MFGLPAAPYRFASGCRQDAPSSWARAKRFARWRDITSMAIQTELMCTQDVYRLEDIVEDYGTCRLGFDTAGQARAAWMAADVTQLTQG
jgi:hypothetical protein